MELRHYQHKALKAAVDEWAKGIRRLLWVMATGTGKTVCFCHEAARTIAAGKRVIILAHRDELVTQAVEKARAVMPGVSIAVEKGDEWSDETGIYGKSQLIVSSIQTQMSGKGGRRRMNRFDPFDFGLAIVDEAHHASADTYIAVIGHYLKNPDCRLLGVTATPDRSDDKDLGKVFETTAYRYDLPDAVADGYLVPIRQRSVVITGLDFSKVRTKRSADGGRDFVESELEAAMIAEKPVQQVASAAIELAYDLDRGHLRHLLDCDEETRVAEVRRMVAGRRSRPALVFCVSVAHAKLMADVLNRWLGPDHADSVDGETETEARKAKFKRFRRGECPFLANCMIATEGTDLPEAEVVVVARPTKSRSLFCQIVGRGTRPLPSLAGELGTMADADARRAAIAASPKPYCLVLDFTDNSRRHELVSAVDLIAPPEIDADLIELARKIAEEKDVTPEDALAEAEDAVAVEQAMARMDAESQAEAEAKAEEERFASWRRQLVGASEYHVSDGDGVGGHVGGNAAKATRGGATEKQVEFLVKLGVRRETAQAYGKAQAGAVITTLKAQRCTTGQAYVLRRHGYTEQQIAGMNFDAASAAIDAAKSQEVQS